MMNYKLVKRRPIKRIYHHYETWECFQAGMYNERKRVERGPFVQLAVNLLKDLPRLKDNMLAAAEEWTNSAQNHLTCRNANRQAWMGQFACCYAHGVGESETREAWSYLTDEERKAANDVADEVILIWEGWHYQYEDSIRNERVNSSAGKN